MTEPVQDNLQNDFASIQDENQILARQIEDMERQFSQTHGEFYTHSKDKAELDMQVNGYRQ
jgi:hypothetical protein